MRMRVGESEIILLFKNFIVLTTAFSAHHPEKSVHVSNLSKSELMAGNTGIFVFGIEFKLVNCNFIKTGNYFEFISY